jgi:hypothetical protein
VPQLANLVLGRRSDHRAHRIVQQPVTARATLCEPPRKPADLSASSAIRRSEKPIALNRRMLAASLGAPSRASSSSAATISAIRSRNQGSYFAIACTSATVKPSRSACAATSSRSGVGRASAAPISARGAP